LFNFHPTFCAKLRTTGLNKLQIIQFVNLKYIRSMSDVQRQIQAHFAQLKVDKSKELQQLHNLIVSLNPQCKLCFDNGINEEGKVVTNPTIGYGLQTLEYAKGNTREFFQIGICATTSGISIYLIGIKDKNFLKESFTSSTGKAIITGYCVKYKRLSELNPDVLVKLIQFGFSKK